MKRNDLIKTRKIYSTSTLDNTHLAIRASESCWCIPVAILPLIITGGGRGLQKVHKVNTAHSRDKKGGYGHLENQTIATQISFDGVTHEVPEPTRPKRELPRAGNYIRTTTVKLTHKNPAPLKPD